MRIKFGRKNKDPKPASSGGGEMKNFHQAAENGDLDAVEYWLNKGTEIDTRDDEGRTALHLAADGGHLAVVEVLVGDGAELGSLDSLMLTPLHNAALNEHKEVVVFLLRYGADIEATGMSDDTWTALHWSAARGCEDAIDFLVELGAEIDRPTSVHEQTALHIATRRGEADAVERLVELGANYELGCKEGLRPLHSAVMRGSEEVVRYLLKNGADPNACDNDANTALHFAASVGNLAVLKMLLAKGGTGIERENATKVTPMQIAIESKHTGVVAVLKDWLAKIASGEQIYPFLHHAALAGDLDAVATFLKEGAKINARDKKKHAPLHYAVMRGNLDVVKYLILQGADVNAQNKEGMTALHLAIRRGGCLEAVSALLKVGANPNHAITERQMTPLHVLVERAGIDNETKVKLIHKLLKAGAHIHAETSKYQTPMSIAVQKRNIRLLDVLLEKETNVDRRDSDGFALMHWAAKEETSNIDALRYLVEKKDANLYVKDDDGSIPLHHTAQVGGIAGLKYLIDERGVDPNITDGRGQTLLHYAVMGGHMVVARDLLRRGVKVEARDRMNRTPLFFAALEGKQRAVELLLSHSADPNMVDDEGKTPLHVVGHGKYGFIGSEVRKKESLDTARAKKFFESMGMGDAMGTFKITMFELNNSADAQRPLVRTAKLLLAAGADASSRDENGLTAMHMAAKKGNSELVKLLLSYGGDKSVRNKEGKIPLHMLDKNADPEMRKLLTPH